MRTFRHTVVYAAGPGNILRTFVKWQGNEDDDHQVAVTYSSQFFETCKAFNLRGVVVSSNSIGGEIETPQFRILNLGKKPYTNALQYHLVQIAYMRRILAIAIEEGADYLVLSDATGHWFPLSWWAPAHLKIIPTFHCTLWPRWLPVKPMQRMLNRLNRSFFTNHCHRILTISKEVRGQLKRVAAKLPPLFSFVPTYRSHAFTDLPAPVVGDKFRVLYAGRMEKNKGVIELLKMASTLKRNQIQHIRMDVCGDGPLADYFTEQIEQHGLEDLIHYHGYCHSKDMKTLVRQANAFIVPTRRDFEEGFNKVVIEAILAGRPVITSKVCPALHWVKPAAIEVPPDNTLAYVKAMVRLSKQPGLYKEKQWSCRACAKPFTDPSLSWGSALQQAMGL